MSLSFDSGWWTLIVALHTAATWFLVGLIWLIQVVHYPSFSAIETGQYAEFQRRHMQRMGQLIGLPWLIEGLTVIGLFVFAPSGTIRVVAAIGGVLEASIIVTTVVSAIPAHTSLSEGFTSEAHARLLRSNLVRTIAWTGRGLIALAVVVLTMSSS